MPSPHILTVEDSLAQRLLLRDQLELAGYRVSGAATAAEALTILANDPPELITLDLRLPDMSGEELCRRIRRQSSVPILVATLYGDELRKVALLDAGADDFVVKPLPRQEFLARIRAVMRRSGAPRCAASPRRPPLSG